MIKKDILTEEGLSPVIGVIGYALSLKSRSSPDITDETDGGDYCDPRCGNCDVCIRDGRQYY